MHNEEDLICDVRLVKEIFVYLWRNTEIIWGKKNDKHKNICSVTAYSASARQKQMIKWMFKHVMSRCLQQSSMPYNNHMLYTTDNRHILSIIGQQNCCQWYIYYVALLPLITKHFMKKRLSSQSNCCDYHY